MKNLFCTVGLIVAFTLTQVLPVNAQPHLKLATTTSTGDTGLLDDLLPVFEKKYDVKVDVISVGTGKALKLGENGDVDVVLVHARALEDAFVASGFGVDRRDVMYNDFIIVGPKEDPAGIIGLKDAAEAFKRIGTNKQLFISRGDESGTHQKEKEIWSKTTVNRTNGWYLEVGQGMSAALRIADEKLGYCLTDRGTYLAQKNTLSLVLLAEKDPTLSNPYGIIAANPQKWPSAQYALAEKLIDWITSPDGQKRIGNFTRYGQQLFTPSASSKK